MKTINSEKLHLKKYKKSEKGMAIIESIPVLIMIVVVLIFRLDFLDLYILEY